MKVYPAWIYHRDFEPRIVQSEAEEAALGPGWVDSPSRVNEPVEEPEEPAKRGRPRKK